MKMKEMSRNEILKEIRIMGIIKINAEGMKEMKEMRNERNEGGML